MKFLLGNAVSFEVFWALSVLLALTVGAVVAWCCDRFLSRALDEALLGCDTPETIATPSHHTGDEA